MSGKAEAKRDETKWKKNHPRKTIIITVGLEPSALKLLQDSVRDN